MVMQYIKTEKRKKNKAAPFYFCFEVLHHHINCDVIIQARKKL
jgi:hypothetical protein